MRTRKPLTTHIICCLAALTALASPAAHAQEAVTPESLETWFYSRLLWGAVSSALLGILIGFYLCRLPFEQRQGLNVNRQAWRRFWTLLIALVVVWAVVLFLDAWQWHEFGPLSLEFREAFSQVWLSLRTLGVLAAVALAFWLAVTLTTRFKPGCHCRYAFLGKPRV
jgi:hypothetical protein